MFEAKFFTLISEQHFNLKMFYDLKNKINVLKGVCFHNK